ncbi:LuxR C-terminal-related transcriptional regulator [Streptomyces sp. NPDC090108]|uniref:LuxR C-terminal-related transcriptional regulator n=1 Tax=Streptomyces sp. NPDC090108 TaxID=3365947 RepID=UPI0037F7836E
MSHTLTIAVVEHHSLVRRGMASLLSGLPSAELAAVVAEPADLDPALPRLDVVVLGPSPDSERSLEAVVGQLARCGRVLVVADFTRPLVATALRAGAFGCVTRDGGDDELIHAVTTVARGGVHISPVLTARLHAELRTPAMSTPALLAHREVETLRLVAAGLTHRQIARRMGLTEATVSTYVKRIRNKLAVGNKADLTRKAIELGLEPGDSHVLPDGRPGRDRV